MGEDNSSNLKGFKGGLKKALQTQARLFLNRRLRGIAFVVFTTIAVVGSNAYLWKKTSHAGLPGMIHEMICLYGPIAALPMADVPPADGLKLQYIEIGTQTWNTLAMSQLGAGLSVDMVPSYLQILQERVSKGSGNKLFLSAAVSDQSSEQNATIWVVNPRFVESGGEFCQLQPQPCMCTPNASGVARQELKAMGIEIDTPSGCLPEATLGCNSMYQPIGDVTKHISPAGKATKLYQKHQIPVASFAKVMKMMNVTSVDLIKVDTEGQDSNVISGVARLMQSRKHFRPRTISWECMHLTRFQSHCSMNHMRRFGYTCERLDVRDCGCALKAEDLYPDMHQDSDKGVFS